MLDIDLFAPEYVLGVVLPGFVLILALFYSLFMIARFKEEKRLISSFWIMVLCTLFTRINGDFYILILLLQLAATSAWIQIAVFIALLAMVQSVRQITDEDVARYIRSLR